jgi:hypothetical protein
MAFEWLKQFEDQHEDFQDDPRSGHPSTSQNADADAVAKVFEMFT